MKTSPEAGRSRILRRVAIGLVLVALGLSVFYLTLLVAAAPPDPMAHEAKSISRGAAIWATTCAACHGPEGRGDGPVTATLPKKPKDLTRIAPPPIFPDGVLAYRIATGGVVMPAWAGVLSEQDIW